MFALSLALCLLAAPLQSLPDDIPGVTVSPTDNIFEGLPTVSKPEPPEPFTQQQPFAQLAASEPALKLLDSGPLLARKISLDETYIPLRLLLAKVSDKNTVLRINGELAELRMRVSLRNRPLSLLMRSLARMLPGTWKKEEDGKTYTLTQTVAAQKYRREWWSIWQEENQRVRRELVKYTVNFLKADPNKVGEYNPPVLTNDASIVVEERQGRKILQMLPDAIQQRFAARYNDSEVQSSFSGYDETEGSLVLRHSDLPNECKDAIGKRFGRWFGKANLDPAKILLSLNNRGANLEGVVSTGRGTAVSNFLVSFMRPDLTFPLRVKMGRLKPVFSFFKNRIPPPLWIPLDKYAAAQIWKVPDIKKPWPLWHQTNMLEVLDTFRDKEQGEFIAECPLPRYKDPKYADGKKANIIRGGNTPPPPKLPEKFETVLPVVATSSDWGWRKTEEGIYLLRDNRWYRQDTAIVSESKLDEWRKRLAADKVRRGEVYAPQTLDEMRQMLDLDAEIVATLSKWQIREGLENFAELQPADKNFPDDIDRWLFPFNGMAKRLLRRYNTLIWYGSLSEPMRTLLVQGRLPFSALTVAQRDGLDFLLPDIALADPDRPLFFGIRPILDLKRTFRSAFMEEGGYDNRGGMELFLISPE